ncbi:MAG: bifunctional [glutamate--ammonia ligase]-adenylyl-L-tyrosine phosphorylase/[glutamate--ammonia-ligase] adenylyltransferase [Burkholderiaceae bacterium]|nr:bifunctional [glutamate--ammonia ligase]-adenylyl-L-tyrosine phosphorylase/[glutamate--ammonia-ligase] adenylyltransferase [Burkholderiaceae bacterium]
MRFRAESFSGYFRRSLFAIEANGGSMDAIERLAGREIDAAVLAEMVRAERETASAPVALRRARRSMMLALMERDIGGLASLDEICRAMTAFARLACSVAMRDAAQDLIEQFGRPCGADGRAQDLLAVMMGKGGADELNVSSDLDLVFVFREEGKTDARLPDGSNARRGSIDSSDFMHRLARKTIEALADITADGFVFRVDTRLRPNGDSGPLVIPLGMLEEYFYAQGREWERFAWLKGRVGADSGMAGADARADDETALARIVQPFVFRRYLDYEVFGALRDLHALIRQEARRRDARRQGQDVKLGRGGIREIEFAAQLFQIVRGGRDLDLRNPATLPTLAALSERGLLPAADVRILVDGYGFLRRVEHALQYREDEQTHRLPADPAIRADVAAMLAMTPEAFEQRLAGTLDAVERVFDQLLADPAEAGSDGESEVDTAQLDDRVGHRIQAMRDGSRYRAARPDARRAIEQLLSTAIAGQTSDDGMIRLIDLCETVCRRPGYLAILARYPQAFERVRRMLQQSRWAADYLNRHPIVLDELIAGDVLEQADYAQWAAQLHERLDDARLEDGPDIERQMDIAREARHAQAFRLLAQDLESAITVERLSDCLSEIADRVLDEAIGRVWSQLRKRHRDVPRFAAIAYGRLGGKELGYSSDLDLVFLYDDDDPAAQEAYLLLAQRLSNWLSTQTTAGVLYEIDLRLRPNGNAGLMVSSLRAFEEYQRESAWVWEHQALTRARFSAGERTIGERFEVFRRELLATPRDGDKLQTEVRSMRKRMHDGHPNRSRLFDIKHDSGGMVDIEFIVQYLVLRHGPQHPALLDNAGNIALLQRAGTVGLLDAALANRVADAYRYYRSIQHAIRLDGAEFARVDPQRVAQQVESVKGAWNAVLG